MDLIWYYAAVALAKTIRAFPLRIVAAVGRAGGGVAYYLDARHRRVAHLNLERCMAGLPPRDRRQIVREHFRRLGENYAAAVKTSGMNSAEISRCLEWQGLEKLTGSQSGAIIAVGHFGNFELYARLPVGDARLRTATTYRAMKQPRLDTLVRRLRDQSGCLFFDRRRDGVALREALARGRLLLGLLCDQHAGSHGRRLPFLGQECSVTTAPALLAQRYHLPLHTAICFRVSPGRWRVEVGDEIATRSDGRRRSAADIMREVMAAFEHAVRRDPANWFWVHDRWRFYKSRKQR